jgi:hypothetical protein
MKIMKLLHLSMPDHQLAKNDCPLLGWECRKKENCTKLNITYTDIDQSGIRELVQQNMSPLHLIKNTFSKIPTSFSQDIPQNYVVGKDRWPIIPYS